MILLRRHSGTIPCTARIQSSSWPLCDGRSSVRKLSELMFLSSHPSHFAALLHFVFVLPYFAFVLPSLCLLSAFFRFPAVSVHFSSAFFFLSSAFFRLSSSICFFLCSFSWASRVHSSLVITQLLFSYFLVFLCAGEVGTWSIFRSWIAALDVLQ